MVFTETPLRGAFVVELEKRVDERGFFARTFCADEFKTHGLNPCLVQFSTAFNLRRGTLRGFHWQAPPKAEDKVIRVTRGAIHDVIVDLRSDSPTYLQHVALELTADNGRMLYIPKGFAHGLQTLTDNTEVFYQMSEFFAPECSRGVRWNDPAFGITWPLPNPIMNERDRNWEDFAK
ncbi:MAG TPA: dTDP-4-dehydrorhamnose 3,5-epimerase [Terriglobales bacterium]|nr:dTDP-4-dehydrorhamnose 3,5-epimerase [Terriglobales bacterium]